jgi:uncharacterized repeat protein (TIGR01451 family)
MPLIRRILSLGLAGLAVAAIVPALASAATPATLRLVTTDPSLGRQITITPPGGTSVTSTPGWFRLRVTPAGQAPVELSGFCADLHHHIGTGTDYAVSMRTVADDAALGTARSAEAGWLVSRAESLIAAAPPAGKGLEAASLQVAVWQLTGQAREVDPTSDAAVNARTAALRALASGRAVGGPLTMTPAMPRGCAGRSAVTLRLSGTPGSTAELSITAGAGTLSASEVRFGADGTATASVASAAPGQVTVAARAQGGTLTRIARASAGQTTPQETLVLTTPRTYTATATVTFEDCPLIPSGGDRGPSAPDGPGNTPSEGPGTPTDSPLVPFEGPSAPATPTTPARPRTPTQVETPRLSVTKSGPRRALAGSGVGYVIRVRNTGEATLRDVAVTDDLPAGMSLARMPSGARLRSGRVVWTIPSLKPGATRVLRVAVRLDADASGRRCNRAGVVAGTLRRVASSCTMVTALRRPVAPAVTA